MTARSEWGEAIQEEAMQKRKRRWRIEISEVDRMMIVMKLERLTPQERTKTEKALLEFMESLPKRGDGKTLIKKLPRKGRKLANRTHNRRQTAHEAAKLMDAHRRRVEAAARKKAKVDRKKLADKREGKTAAKATKKATTKKKGSSKK